MLEAYPTSKIGLSAVAIESEEMGLPGLLETSQIRRRRLCCALIQSPDNGVVRVPLSPACLCLLPPGSLTFRLSAGSPGGLPLAGPVGIIVIPA